MAATPARPVHRTPLLREIYGLLLRTHCVRQQPESETGRHK